MKYKLEYILCIIPIYYILSFFPRDIIKSNSNKNIRSLKEESEIIHLVKFNFTTSHNPNEMKDPISYLILNDVNIPINVGTPIQTIQASLRFNDYLFYLSSPFINLTQGQNKKNIFNNKTSSTYKLIAQDSLFYKSNLFKGERANETFHFKLNDYNEKLNNFTFYYSTSMYYNQSGGVVGLCLEDSNMNLHSGMNFFTQLKNKKAIYYKTFFIKYNKDNETGEITIGAYPHEYSKSKYNFENYLDMRGYAETTYVIYGIIFDEIIFGENIIFFDSSIKNIMTADLRLDFGFIQAPKFLEKNITESFINLDKCKAYKTQQKEIYGNRLFGPDEYLYYICDEDYEINMTISFKSKELGYTFEFDNNDLFLKYGNKKYFNILINQGYHLKSWIFGKPMFLKYKWVFDPDKKRLGIYTKEELDNNELNSNNKNIILLSILIISVIAFIVVLIVFIYQLIKSRKNRKNRKNEILEDYDYDNAIN